MKIELKNIKHSAFASQETHCYEASLYIDGKKIGTVSNDGHGGCDNFWGDNKKFAEAEAWLKEHGETREFHGTTLHEDLEMRCCDLVNQWLKDREIKKMLKRITYIKGDAVYQLPARLKPTPQNLANVMRTQWWNMKYIMVSGLSLDEARVELNRIGF